MWSMCLIKNYVCYVRLVCVESKLWCVNANLSLKFEYR